MLAHGLDAAEAKRRKDAPYEQEWVATEEEGEWRVVTDNGRRDIVYHLGEWEEPFAGGSDLFGKEAGVANRNTVWTKHPTQGWLHITESATPLGWESTKRRVTDNGEVMLVERQFTPRDPDGAAGEPIVGEERFKRCD